MGSGIFRTISLNGRNLCYRSTIWVDQQNSNNNKYCIYSNKCTVSLLKLLNIGICDEGELLFMLLAYYGLVSCFWQVYVWWDLNMIISYCQTLYTHVCSLFIFENCLVGCTRVMWGNMRATQGKVLILKSWSIITCSLQASDRVSSHNNAGHHRCSCSFDQHFCTRLTADM